MEATWEAADRVNDNAKIEQYRAFNTPAKLTQREVEAGGFLINDVPQFRADQMPYGGVKLSGTGREGPRYAMEEMTERKLIVWRV